MNTISFDLFSDKSLLPKKPLRPKFSIPKWYGILTKQNLKEYLTMLTAYVECLENSEITKLDIVNNAICDSAKDWFLYKRSNFRNYFKFCEEFVLY